MSMPHGPSSHGLRVLPRETLDLVMELLSDVSNGSSISPCSLVCKGWLPSVQRQLFMTLRLSDERNGITRCSSGLLLFKDSPHLMEYVRDVRLFFGNSMQLLQRSRLLKERSLPMFLRSFTKVHTLHLSTMVESWSDVSFDLLEALNLIMELSSFQHLMIYGWKFPNSAKLAQFLEPCAANLTTLFMSSIGVESTILPPAPGHMLSLNRLRNLEIGAGLHPFYLRPYPFSAPNLRNLDWKVGIEEAAAFGSLLRGCDPNQMTDLNLGIYLPNYKFSSHNIESSVETFPDLSLCTHLRRLTLELSYYDLYFHDDAIRWAAACIRRLPRPGLIELLVLQVDISSDTPLSYWDYNAWATLDSALAPVRDGVLGKMYLRLNITGYDGPTDPNDPDVRRFNINGSTTPIVEVVHRIRDSMQGLENSGKLRIQLSQWQ